MENRLDVTQTIERWGIRFTGIVQGVGFRPLVSILAHQLSLVGFVYNDGHGVYVEAQGALESLDLFVDAVKAEAPRLARITHVSITPIPVVENISTTPGEQTDSFVIKPSPKGLPIKTFISADTAPCDECLEEMNGPLERRHNYSFINCIHCGPRYTIIKSMPYDRERTTMNDFPMCQDCEEEYKFIEGRRYHAEPNACAICGPHYTLLDNKGNPVPLGDSNWVDVTRQYIENGSIVGIKGVGGYHLVCNVYNDDAVQTLRERKQRQSKPLALMAGSLDAIDRIAHIKDEDLDLLLSPVRPIVLLTKKELSADNGHEVSSHVAYNTNEYGIMLPYSPMHNVLLPEDALWIMTSGNYSGDPVLYRDDDALEQLTDVVDYFLVHNRQICAPVDDSVVASSAMGPLIYRRSRGFVPEPIHCESLQNTTTLAMGADMKNAFAFSREQEVLLGPHIGDLERSATHDMLERTIKHYMNLFDVCPEKIVVDQHPQYFSSRLGYAYGSRYDVDVVPVQHHHSHIASVMAEYNLKGPVLGICFDGAGYGDDGTMWGGEFLYCQGASYERLVHLQTAPLPGGETAVKEPWRQALWYLRHYYGQDVPPVYEKWLQTLPENWKVLDQAMNSDMPFILSSGAGRLFDAVGCLLGLGNVHAYDGQVPMDLEQLAQGERGMIKEFNYDGRILDFTPLVQFIMDDYAKGVSPAILAATFHRTLAVGIREVTSDLLKRYAVNHVVLGGGVFQNRRLLEELKTIWHDTPWLMNKAVPCNDGGIALGQLWIANEVNKYHGNLQ